MKKLSLLAALVLLFGIACNPSKKAGMTNLDKNKSEKTEMRALPPVVVEGDEEGEEAEEGDMAESGPYQASAKRAIDLLHTKLDVRFDWKLQQVIGKATLTLRQFFYPSDVVVLDAKNFDFKKVSFEGKPLQLKYDYDGKQITIHLDRVYKNDEEIKLYMEYVAKPEEEGGSAAITSDKGLFFINPDGSEAGKPRQIWTQGETENNSRWFPTVDKPNERCTEEIYITVEDHFKTLSNGIMVSSVKNADGTRTDYWKMDKPHAPYLFMLAVGDFAVVKDKWNGIDVDYYVEPEFEKYARDIFPYTTEMLQFYSDRLGVTYPWPKFSQIVVRDYVSGAMENTTAVIFGEFMQGTDQELMDNQQNELVVAHEMFHHWFGDLVTCESWSNLTLNEGFANYSEYLWLEHKHGKDAADEHWQSESEGYKNSAINSAHDLIDFHYDDKESMFDGHSYNKGGCILHMLRNYVGDDAFFAALKNYLSKNAYTDVEAHELRLSFEDVTGEDLSWFFNQWFYSKGHPELRVSYDYDDNDHTVTLHVEQTQEEEGFPEVFELPLAVDIYDAAGKVQHEKIRVNERTQDFTFKSASHPALVNFDADRILLGDVNYNKSDEEMVFQFQHAPKFMDRMEALTQLQGKDDKSTAAVYTAALKDPFWGIRREAVANISSSDAAAMTTVAQLAVNDPHSAVRGAAMGKLAETEDKKFIPVFKEVIQKEKSVFVVSDAVNALNILDPAEGLLAVKKLESSENTTILNGVAEIYAGTKDPQYLPFFEKTLPKMASFSKINFMGHYGTLAAYADEATRTKALEMFEKGGMKEDQKSFDRFAYCMGIASMRKELKAQANDAKDQAVKDALLAKTEAMVETMKAIQAKETNEQIRMIYMQLIMMP